MGQNVKVNISIYNNMKLISFSKEYYNNTGEKRCPSAFVKTK